MDTAKGGSRVCRAAREDLHRTMRPKGGQKEGGQKRWSGNNRTVGEVAGALRESVQNWRGVSDTSRQFLRIDIVIVDILALKMVKYIRFRDSRKKCHA